MVLSNYKINALQCDCHIINYKNRLRTPEQGSQALNAIVQRNSSRR